MNLPILLNKNNGIPLGQQLEKQIRVLILDGTLEEGDLLPPARTLAKVLGVNINTVIKVYQLLAMKGWLRLRRGLGTFVAGGPKTATRDKDQFKALEEKVKEVIALADGLELTHQELFQFLEQRWGREQCSV